MKAIGHRFWDNIWFARVMLFLLGLALLGGGVRALRGDRLFYQNYWGGPVFAPLAVVLGLFVLVMLGVKWNTLTEKGDVLKGKAARKARKAKLYKSTIDDFDKPWNG